MDLKIVEFLTSREEPVETMGIVKALDLKTAKEINPTLYGLLNQGKVSKVSDIGGQKPKWFVIEKDGKRTERSESNSPKYHPDLEGTHQQLVLELLSTSKEPMKTLNISKVIFGQKATCKDINPLLYSMLKQGLLDKISDEGGKNPRWTKAK